MNKRARGAAYGRRYPPWVKGNDRLDHCRSQRQQGVALLVALVILAAALALVTGMVGTGRIAHARAVQAIRAEQAAQLLHGLELWALQMLRDRQNLQRYDTAASLSALVMPPVPVPGGTVSGRLLPADGCFNVNRLALPAEAQAATAALGRLLNAGNAPVALAPLIRDAIDLDSDVSPGGAESAAWLGFARRTPPDRAIVDLTELSPLAAITGFDPAQLAGSLCALPAEAATNLNLAGAAFWRSLAETIDEPAAARLTAKAISGFTDFAAVTQAFDELGLELPDLGCCALRSSVFFAEANIEVDGVNFRFTSLLEANPDRTRVIARGVSRPRQPQGGAEGAETPSTLPGR